MRKFQHVLLTFALTNNIIKTHIDIQFKNDIGM